MKKEITPKSFGIDCDGTVVYHDYPFMGESIDHCVNVLKRLQGAGHTLILITMRHGHLLDDAIEWFRNNGIRITYSNHNPEFETGSRKIYCSGFYIDDRGIGAPTVFNPEIHPKPFVNWYAVEKLLEEKGYL